MLEATVEEKLSKGGQQLERLSLPPGESPIPVK